MRLLDTDILIDLLRRHPPAVAWFATLTEVPGVPGLVVMELIQGCTNAADLRAVTKLVKPLRVVWPTEADCRRALADVTHYRLAHHLGALDALIGACTIGLGATLCTFNVKHYQVMVGLATEQPYTR